jgi:outer membrane protein TolC
MNGKKIHRLTKPRSSLGLITVVLLPLVFAPGCQSDGELRHVVGHARPTVDVMEAGPSITATSGQLTAESAAVARASVIPPPCADRPIDLATALALAGADNPTIALAEEAVRESEAGLLQARALALPTVNGGMNYRDHQGNLLSSGGIIRDVHSSSLYAGLGASARAAETVGIPGVRVFAHVADAWFEPRAAAFAVAGRQFEAAATRNDILLEVVTRYLDLASAEERLRAHRRTENELSDVSRMTADFARTGQGREGDAERARTELLLARAETDRAEEAVATAAAELARLLSIDPSVRLRPVSEPLPLFRLVDSQLSVGVLIEIAVANRPEVGARTAELALTQTRLREEKVRPFVPLLSVGYSAGNFGGGSNQVEPRFGRFDGRSDFDAWAVWSLANFGIGNLAVQKARRAEVGQAEAVRAQVVDQVRREVAESHGMAAARLLEVETARRRLATAAEGARLDIVRARNVEGRPIEVLNSLRLLNAARLELIQAIVAYDQAEFRLFVALGQPPAVPVTRNSSDQ